MFTSAFRFQFVWRVTSYRLEKSPHLKDFNPHPPHGGWQQKPLVYQQHMCDFNPHPPHGGWRWQYVVLPPLLQISIHTLRMEGDVVWYGLNWSFELFQSTPSAWRVTPRSTCSEAAYSNFNPHPPHGGWLQGWAAIFFYCFDFNPHPPHGGWRHTSPKYKSPL